ncbi:DUF4097 family beta strand repeat-containing protein [Streptomyces viridochromogenes]|uniref:Putative Lipoprotein n=1 Tax=Streptomyces viridochromogenes Tue57 TaxID=1160705 RepID=L8PC72_STRVR|nr:DUF4097 family beta strand repeat-containing protein [Streptomyces viridochromogenes]ELS52927.1 putative Lipoprotein [Streptomyces viridochromogenes Tue57]
MARTVPARAAAVAGVVVALVAGLAACGASAAEDKDPEHRSFALEGRTLTVDSDDSALEIVAADAHKAGTVEVTRWFQGSVAIGSDPKATWSFQDDRLVLRQKCSGVIVDCSAKHRIEVPHGITVKVKDEDGGVRARGFRDTLSVHTRDGSVQVTDSSGPLDLKTGDGSVRVSDVSSRRVKAQSGDGSVRLELGTVPDRVETRSGDGSVTIELPRATYRVTTETGDGSVDVSVPRDDTSPHVVSAHTGDGKVTVRTAN